MPIRFYALVALVSCLVGSNAFAFPTLSELFLTPCRIIFAKARIFGEKEPPDAAAIRSMESEYEQLSAATLTATGSRFQKLSQNQANLRKRIEESRLEFMKADGYESLFYPKIPFEFYRDIVRLAIEEHPGVLAWKAAFIGKNKTDSSLAPLFEMITIVSAVEPEAFTKLVNLKYYRPSLRLIFDRFAEKLSENPLEPEAAAKKVKDEYSAKLAESVRNLIDFERLKQSYNVIVEGKLADSLDLGSDVYREIALAYRVIDGKLDISKLSAEDAQVLNDFARAFDHTFANPYKGTNAALRDGTMTFTEPVKFGFENAPIDAFIRNNEFRDRDPWWKPAKFSGTFTAATSGSPLKALYGNQAIREIYWPGASAKSSTLDNLPDLNRLRIAVNRSPDKNGVMQDRSLEVMYRDVDGNWNPFFYVKQEGVWVPMEEFMGKPKKESCGGCHANAAGKFSPRPPNIRATAESLIRSGYNPKIVPMLMQF